jgi:molybdopterin synthase sulfur carrier subunit
MRVTVKVFAHLRERLGFEETALETPAEASVADVWRAVSSEESLPGHVLAAVNLDYASGDTPVRDGDEVAFFPPVTGG